MKRASGFSIMLLMVLLLSATAATAQYIDTQPATAAALGLRGELCTP